MTVISGKYIAKTMLESKHQRPLWGIIRNFIFSLLFTIVVIIISLIIGITISAQYFYAVMFISCFIFYFGWGSERLWYAFISNLFDEPFSLTAYLTRLPFWFLSGGIALSFSTLLVYKFELIDLISSTRQYKIFLYGGILNILIQLPLQYYTYYSMLAKLKITGKGL